MLHLSLVFLISLQIVGLQLGDFSFNSESKYIKAQQLVVASFQKSNSEIHIRTCFKTSCSTSSNRIETMVYME